MLKIAVCDDERTYLEKIKNYIIIELKANYVEDFVIKTFNSGIELFEAEKMLNEYQVFFLDINMEEMNGLEIAQKIRENNSKALLVLVTAYIDYAMEGYKVEAIRFIIKDMLQEMMPECIYTIIKKLRLKNHKIEYNFAKGKKEIFTDSVVYIESDRHRVIFYVFNSNNLLDEYYLYDKLDNVEQELKNYGFLRIHKSYLVNMQYIEDILRYKAVLSTGAELPIPRDKYIRVEQKYYENAGEML